MTCAVMYLTMQSFIDLFCVKKHQKRYRTNGYVCAVWTNSQYKICNEWIAPCSSPCIDTFCPRPGFQLLPRSGIFRWLYDCVVAV